MGGLQGHHRLHCGERHEGIQHCQEGEEAGHPRLLHLCHQLRRCRGPGFQSSRKRREGYKYAIGLLNEGRIGIAAQMTGLALGAWENAARYVWNDRKQFGSLVGEFQGMQFQLAQAYTDITAARALVYNAAQKKEAGLDFVRDAAMAKLFASQVAGRVSGNAIEWMGGMGFVREGLAEKYWRDSKIGAIYEGTSNIQLQTIARLLQREYSG